MKKTLKPRNWKEYDRFVWAAFRAGLEVFIVGKEGKSKEIFPEDQEDRDYSPDMFWPLQPGQKLVARKKPDRR